MPLSWLRLVSLYHLNGNGWELGGPHAELDNWLP